MHTFDVFRSLAGSYILLSLIALATTAFYFMPAIVARRRHHKNFLAIGLTNLLLGWTVVGWVGALIWSVTDNTAEAR